MRECPRCEQCYADDILVCPEDSTKTKFTLPGGTLLNHRYELEKRLGRGAMGQVYLAQDKNLLVRRVAVKTVRPDFLNNEEMQEGEAIARFEREARTAASIRHPNVVDVTDFGKSPEGVFYLVMEYVQGETLHHLLRREGTLSVARTLALLRQVAAGVEAAHEENILHRDLKPANIFIMQPSKKKAGAGLSDGFVKVGDFGLAKIVSEAVTEADEHSGGGPQSRGIIGTPEYMAPEQMQSGALLDARADVYALGTIAYHMLGGRPPFSGDLAQLIMQKMMQAPPALSTLRSDIGVEVERAVMHALAKEPEARSATVAEWLEELEEAAGQGAEEAEGEGDSRVIVMAPMGAEVYVDDERAGTVGRSGRLVLTTIAPGRHVLRVARAGDVDDERVIEIRPEASEQIIQAQLRTAGGGGSQVSPSRAGGASSSIGSGPASSIPGLVICKQCGSRFAAGVKFCGRCGSTSFQPIADAGAHTAPPQSQQQPFPAPPQPSGGSQYGGPSVYGHAAPNRCQRCGTNYPIGTKFCGRCGIPIQAAMGTAPPPRPQQQQVICPTCRTNYAFGTKFCGRCGTIIRV